MMSSTKKGFLLPLYKMVIFAILNLGQAYYVIQHFKFITGHLTNGQSILSQTIAHDQSVWRDQNEQSLSYCIDIYQFW